LFFELAIIRAIRVTPFYPWLKTSGQGYIRVGFVFNPTQRWEFAGGKNLLRRTLKFSSLVFT
jgi:hypothetical protein